MVLCSFFFFFQAEDGIRDADVTGVQTCALPIYEDVMVFSMRHGAQYDLFALQPGSPGPIRLTTDPEDDRTPAISPDGSTLRSEERRVGKECRSRWWAEQ